MAPSLSIIFPSYKQKNLVTFLKKYSKELYSINKNTEIILVADCISKEEQDKFKTSLKNVKFIFNPNRMGKGYAIRKGFQSASGNIIGFLDADNPISIKDVPKLIQNAKKGCAIGSRQRSDYTSPIRNLLSLFFNKYISILFGFNFNDTQCGAKFFKKAAIKKILPNLTINGFAMDIEILYNLGKNNMKITEVPVKWKSNSNTTISIFSILEMAIDCLKIRFFN